MNEQSRTTTVTTTVSGIVTTSAGEGARGGASAGPSTASGVRGRQVASCSEVQPTELVSERQTAPLKGSDHKVESVDVEYLVNKKGVMALLECCEL